MINFILTGVQWFCYLYTAYVIVMAIKHNYNYKSWHWSIRYLAIGIFIPFYLGDIVWNIVFGSILFLQLPLWDKDQTFSHRLNVIKRTHDPDHWRVKITNFIGYFMLNIADEDHYDRQRG